MLRYHIFKEPNVNKPNILIFMTDQQRGDTVLPGSQAIMPNIDKFRTQGLTFSNARCPSPHCCPSRASFFSGLFPTGHGVWNNVNVGNTLSRGLAEGVRLWSEDLAKGGYNLRYSGKWHISDQESPADRGWTEGFVTAMPGRGQGEKTMWGMYEKIAQESRAGKRPEDAAPLDAAGNPIMKDRPEGFIPRPGYPRYTHYGTRENSFRDDDVVQDALKFLADLQKKGAAAGSAATADAPWALYVGTLGPHDPYFPPQRFLDMYKLEDIKLPPNFRDGMDDKPRLYLRTRRRFDSLSELEHREAIRHYLAFCSYQDYLFGLMLEGLERTGQTENTLVMYLSDHGDYMGEHGLWCKGLPCFQGAYNVPAIVRWPAGIKKPGRIEAAKVNLGDFAPTILEAAGLAPRGPSVAAATSAATAPSLSLMPFYRAEQPKAWRTEHYTQSNGNELYGIQRSVSDAKYKYVYNGFDLDEFYDLGKDPGEMVNQAANPAYAELVREYCGKMWRFARDNGDTSVNPYIMVSLASYGPAEAYRE
jgi:arylsulfatase A-like enzyme